MAIAKKCDLCGKYFEPNPKGWHWKIEKYATSVNTGRYQDHTEYDICWGCLVSLEEWLDSRKALNENIQSP